MGHLLRIERRDGLLPRRQRRRGWPKVARGFGPEQAEGGLELGECAQLRLGKGIGAIRIGRAGEAPPQLRE